MHLLISVFLLRQCCVKYGLNLPSENSFDNVQVKTYLGKQWAKFDLELLVPYIYFSRTFFKRHRISIKPKLSYLLLIIKYVFSYFEHSPHLLFYLLCSSGAVPGFTKSEFLVGALPFSDHSACGHRAVLRGIEMGYSPQPVHHIHVQSKLITGFFHVAVCLALPIRSISLLMGNDIAGGKVTPALEDLIRFHPVQSLVHSHKKIMMSLYLTVCLCQSFQETLRGRSPLNPITKVPPSSCALLAQMRHLWTACHCQ